MEALWDKLLFWKKKQIPKTFKEGKHYKLTDYGNEIIAVSLLFSVYDGIKYHYTQVKVLENDVFATLKFGFVILESGNYTKEELENDSSFVQIMGDILVILLSEKNNESFRKNYPEEPDL